MTWNIIALCADFFVLSGAVLQVAGTFWVRHIARAKNLTMPSGATGVDVRTTRDNLNVYGFLSIGIGSVYFVLNDFGISSSSQLLLGLCILEAIILATLGFVSYSVGGKNDEEIWRWQVWPLHSKPFFGVLFGDLVMTFVVFLAWANGFLDWTALPLLSVSFSLAVYLVATWGGRTVKRL